ELPDHSAAPATTPTEPVATIFDKLLTQLSTLETPMDIAHFGMEVSKRTDLDTPARLNLANAVTAQLAKVAMTASDAAEAKAEGRKRKPAKAAAEEPPAEAAAVEGAQEPVAAQAATGSAIRAY